MNKILRRIAKNHSYHESVVVFNQLSDSDKLLISPRGKFIDSPYLIERCIKYNNDNEPIGFSEAYKYNDVSNDTAFVVVAVLKKYRSLGIGSYLIQSIVNECFNQGYSKIIYQCDPENEASAALAKKNGFKLVSTTKDELIFEKVKDINYQYYYPETRPYAYQRSVPLLYSGGYYRNFYAPNHYWYGSGIVNNDHYLELNINNSNNDYNNNDITNSIDTNFSEFSRTSEASDFASDSSDGGE